MKRVFVSLLLVATAGCTNKSVTAPPWHPLTMSPPVAEVLVADPPPDYVLNHQVIAHSGAIPAAVPPDYTNRDSFEGLCNAPAKFAGSAIYPKASPLQKPLMPGDIPGLVWGATFTSGGVTYRALCK